MFGGTNKITNASHTAIILSLWLVQLDPHPLPTGKFGGATKAQCGSLQKSVMKKDSINNMLIIMSINNSVISLFVLSLGVDILK